MTKNDGAVGVTRMRGWREPGPGDAVTPAGLRVRGLRFRSRWLATLCLPAVLLVAGGRGVRAQADDEPEPRLPGGQMVRGTVTAVGDGRFTLKSETGELFQVTATANTRIVEDRQPVKMSDVKVGEGVGAGGILDGGTHTLHAAFIFLISADEVRRAQADLGKTYIIGRIAAIHDLRLTIHRPDGVDQVIGVDEGTSFRRGGREGGRQAGSGGERPPTGESITLADLSVGESIAARGTLKNGVFTPTELHVLRDRRAHSGDGNGGGAAAAPQGSRP